MKLFFSALLVGSILGITACATPQLDTIPQHQTFTIQSKHTQETRVINVYLPPNYSTDTDTKFPVVYMPDGGLKEDFPHIVNSIDEGIKKGDISPRIVVGIENTVRRRDLTGPTSVAQDREVAPVVGGSEAFRQFIKTELFPQIEGKYRVSASRSIIGESLAGLFIVETFVKDASMFDTYIALSPSLWWNNHALVSEAERTLKAAPDLQATISLSAANEKDIYPHVESLGIILKTSAPKGVLWTSQVHLDLRHDTIYRALAPTLMRKHFAANKSNK